MRARGFTFVTCSPIPTALIPFCFMGRELWSAFAPLFLLCFSFIICPVSATYSVGLPRSPSFPLFSPSVQFSLFSHFFLPQVIHYFTYWQYYFHWWMCNLTNHGFYADPSISIDFIFFYIFMFIHKFPLYLTCIIQYCVFILIFDIMLHINLFSL